MYVECFSKEVSVTAVLAGGLINTFQVRGLQYYKDITLW